MKLRKRGIAVIVLVCIAIVLYFLFPESKQATLKSFQMRSVWFSYIDLEEFSYDSQEAFRNDFSQAIDKVSDIYTNNVIVQVRPFADALYKSKLYPTSQMISHSSSLSFDPLTEMIDIAHEKDMTIEAWINPYRISLSEKSYKQFANYSSKKAWLNDSTKTIHYGQYQFIFNPASSTVRKYIVDGVKEVAKNYDVDGIHFDDYFYIQGTHDGTSENERIDNVNMLIQEVYQSIKQINKDIIFGISPQGNYENCINEGADVDTWLSEEGYVDYLMPQIYWTDQYGEDGQTTMFSDRAKLFASLKRNNDIDIYAGLAIFNCGEEMELDKGWSNSSSNLASQIDVLKQYGYSGYSLFHYNCLDNEATKAEIDELLKQHPYS